MLISCALFCHAPVVIPEIAGKHAGEISQTSDAMLRAAKWVVASKPVRIVVLSPHATRLSESFSVSSGAEIEGTFSEFGHPEIHLRFPNAGLLGGALCMPEAEVTIRVLPAPQTPLDHGSAVPLYFLQQAGWHGPVLVVGFPANPTPAECHGSESLRSSVGEDVVDSLQIAAAAVDFSAHNHQLFSYEGPFGVGYLVAGLYADAA